MRGLNGLNKTVNIIVLFSLHVYASTHFFHTCNACEMRRDGLVEVPSCDNCVLFFRSLKGKGSHAWGTVEVALLTRLHTLIIYFLVERGSIPSLFVVTPANPNLLLPVW